MAKKKNFFGIRKGIHPETKEMVINQVVEAPWDMVKEYVLGVKGAEYSGFPTKEEAIAYVGAIMTPNEPDTRPTSLSLDPHILSCFVDGSYNKDIPNYGYGLVCVKNGKVLSVDKGEGKNPEAIEMFQVGGELLGAMKALLYAKKQGHQKVVIYHDYEGVGKHATGEWKRKTAFSKVYYEWMQKFFTKNPEISVRFQKVDAHTGQDFNELADGYAKLAVGIKPNPIFYRMAEKYQVPNE